MSLVVVDNNCLVTILIRELTIVRIADLDCDLLSRYWLVAHGNTGHEVIHVVYHV